MLIEYIKVPETLHGVEGRTKAKREKLKGTHPSDAINSSTASLVCTYVLPARIITL